jgi:hypothetical protein
MAVECQMLCGAPIQIVFHGGSSSGFQRCADGEACQFVVDKQYLAAVWPFEKMPVQLFGFTSGYHHRDLVGGARKSADTQKVGQQIDRV